MEFIHSTGVDDTDLRILAERLIGTRDHLQDHVNVLGIEIGCLSDLVDDLSRYTFQCESCRLWTKAPDFELGVLCDICYEEIEEEIADMLDDFDDDDDFGFDENDFDDDDILDEIYDDHWFDETDDEEDDL